MASTLDIAVYAIRNTQNGRAYVGGSTQVRRRWKLHYQSLNRGQGQPELQRDWNAYGSDAFSFEIVERVASVAALCIAEQAHIDRHRAEGCNLYNRRLTVESTYGGIYPWWYD